MPDEPFAAGAVATPLGVWNAPFKFTPSASKIRLARSTVTPWYSLRSVHGELSSIRMNALKAHVENGRIVIDGSIDLPEGTMLEVDLRVPDGEDDLSDAERERLHQALDKAVESVRAGRTVDADEAINRVLSRS